MSLNCLDHRLRLLSLPSEMHWLKRGMKPEGVPLTLKNPQLLRTSPLSFITPRAAAVTKTTLIFMKRYLAVLIRRRKGRKKAVRSAREKHSHSAWRRSARHHSTDRRRAYLRLSSSNSQRQSWSTRNSLIIGEFTTKTKRRAGWGRLTSTTSWASLSNSWLSNSYRRKKET